MEAEIENVILKINNGGEILHHSDLQLLIDKLRVAANTISRISVVSNAPTENESSMKCALTTIKDLTADFMGAANAKKS